MPRDAAASRTRLVVLYGGRSAEHDVSCVTAAHVLGAIDASRYEIVAVGISRDGRWCHDPSIGALATGDPAHRPGSLPVLGDEVDVMALISAADVDVVVLPLLHGPFGEDGTVQGMLELAGVPYVGAGVLGSALSMDKAKAKEVLAHAGIPQARYRSFHDSELGPDTADAVIGTLGLPLFVKPANLGSSIGVSKATDRASFDAAVELALSYDEWIVFEEAVVGREIEVAVLGNSNPRVSVPGEIIPGADFYDYEDKYVDGSATLVIPAVLPHGVAEQAGDLARRSFAALRAEGMARVDFFYEEDGRGLLLNEINTIPGFTPISMYPKLWAASGIDYADLVDRLIELAVERHQHRKFRTRTDRIARS